MNLPSDFYTPHFPPPQNNNNNNKQTNKQTTTTTFSFCSQPQQQDTEENITVCILFLGDARHPQTVAMTINLRLGSHQLVKSQCPWGQPGQLVPADGTTDRLRQTPSLAFRHPPPHAAGIGHATEGALFKLSPRSCPPTLSEMYMCL